MTEAWCNGWDWYLVTRGAPWVRFARRQYYPFGSTEAQSWQDGCDDAEETRLGK